MSLSTLNDLAYDTWEPGLNDELETTTGSLYSFLQKSSKDVKGRKTFIKFLKGRSLGVANIDEGGQFPDAGDPSYDEAEIALKRIAATVEFTLDEMDLLNGRDAAALPVVQHKLDDLVRTVRRDVVRQTWGDGSAKLANCASVTGQVITLDATTSSQIDRDRYNWLEENGLKIDVVHGTTGASQATGLTITDIDRSTDAVTVVGTASGVTSAGVIVRSGNAYGVSSAYTSREFTGLMGAISDSNTYLTIDRTVAGNGYWWKSNVSDNSGTLRPVTLDVILQLINEMNRRTGKAPLDSDHAFFANLGVWSAYGEQLQPSVRYQGYSKMDMGWPELEIFGVPLYGDIHAPHNNLFLIHKPSFAYRVPKYQDRGTFQFQNMDGSVWRYVPGTSGYKAKVQSHLTGMMTLLTEHPRMHGRVDDLEELGV